MNSTTHATFGCDEDWHSFKTLTQPSSLPESSPQSPNDADIIGIDNSKHQGI